MPITLGYKIRMEDKARYKGAGQKSQRIDQTKTLHVQFKFFTANHSHSEFFDKYYNVFLLFI